MYLSSFVLYPDKNSFTDNSGNYRLVTVDGYRHRTPSPSYHQAIQNGLFLSIYIFVTKLTMQTKESCSGVNISEQDCIRPSVLCPHSRQNHTDIPRNQFYPIFQVNKYGCKKVRNLTLKTILWIVVCCAISIEMPLFEWKFIVSDLLCLLKVLLRPFLLRNSNSRAPKINSIKFFLQDKLKSFPKN